MKQSIWFVVLTYYPRENNVERSVARLSGFHVIVSDNTPGSPTITRNGMVTRMKNGKNLGYTGGMNVGIRHALKNGADWVILLNDDIRFSKIDVLKLTEQLHEVPSGVAGPFAGTLDNRRWTSVYPAPVQSTIRYISGSCLAIHRDVFKRIGFFYEPYFIYYEDVEFCVRAKHEGFSVVHLTLPGFGHTDGATFGPGSKKQEYYLSRNHLLFVERNAPPTVKLYEYLRLPKTIAQYVYQRNYGGFLGLRDYFTRRFYDYRR